MFVLPLPSLYVFSRLDHLSSLSPPLRLLLHIHSSLFCSHPLLQQKKKTEEKLRLHSVVVLVCVFCCVAGVLEKNTVRSEVKLTSQCGSPRRHKMVFSLCTISKSLDWPLNKHTHMFVLCSFENPYRQKHFLTLNSKFNDHNYCKCLIPNPNPDLGLIKN